jgi:Fe2+ transport protein
VTVNSEPKEFEMSDMSTGASAPETGWPPGVNSSRRAAAVAAGLALALVAVVVLVHVARGTPKPTSSAAAAATTTSNSMAMSSPSAMPIPPTQGSTVMTVRGVSLPVMPTSSAMPMAMPMVPLGQALWEGMRIQARTSAPATFVVFDGTSQQLVRPTANDSFHLMVTLADAKTNFAIPYSSVWATIRKGSRIVFDERLWPMISRYMGPHYGDNVSLPNAGLYHMTLLVSPPVAARHLEYKGLWLKPHRVNLTFRWVPKT